MYCTFLSQNFNQLAINFENAWENETRSNEISQLYFKLIKLIHGLEDFLKHTFKNPV